MIASRYVRVALTAAVLLVVPVAGLSGAHAEQAQGCAVTAVVAGSPAEAADLRAVLAEQAVPLDEGVRLDEAARWVVPDGGELVLVVEPTTGAPAATVSRFGWSRPAELAFEEHAGGRLVSTAPVPYPGGLSRTMALELGGHGCDAAVAVAADRSAFSTVAGLAGLAGAVLFGAAAVVAARLRTGGWARRFGWAAPPALLAGAGEVLLLYEAGVLAPAGRGWWWLPLGAVGVAAVLPLTRRRRQRRRAGGVPVPPPVGSWRPVGLFAGTGTAQVWRAVGADPAQRALVKVTAAGHAGEPAVALRGRREAELLAGQDHPNWIRLRETVGGGGAPALVFEDVDGAPLRELSGELSGAQSVTVALGLLAGLAAVHERGLVHRQVGPDTVWLDTAGRVLLAGFELAGPGVEHPVAPEGGGPYASPEQQRAQTLDERSDLFSCAVVLHELLAGHLPPGGQARIPEPIAPLLVRALAAEPAGRPASADRFAAELREAAAQAYGPDWSGRGALAGALAAHGAIGSAAAGYGLAGAGQAAGATGTGPAAAAAGAGQAGAGSATVAGLGSAAPAGVGAGGAGAAGASGGAAAAGAGTSVAASAGTSVAASAGAGAAVSAGAGFTAGPVTAAVVTGALLVASGAVLAGAGPPGGPGAAPAPASAVPTVVPMDENIREFDFANSVVELPSLDETTEVELTDGRFEYTDPDAEVPVLEDYVVEMVHGPAYADLDGDRVLDAAAVVRWTFFEASPTYLAIWHWADGAPELADVRQPEGVCDYTALAAAEAGDGLAVTTLSLSPVLDCRFTAALEEDLTLTLREGQFVTVEPAFGAADRCHIPEGRDVEDRSGSVTPRIARDDQAPAVGEPGDFVRVDVLLDLDFQAAGPSPIARLEYPDGTLACGWVSD